MFILDGVVVICGEEIFEFINGNCIIELLINGDIKVFCFDGIELIINGVDEDGIIGVLDK